ncbi:hypothetical protein BJ165DRAFT_744743 [Panaeolus papilionaceus]|nr:hypothetical protein BJ165DRAFT_744743 [Panaeolus papilionaceus]
MGPTGAGKSSFIETYKGESQQLSISKNQLEGYTQTVNPYRLVNVMYQGSYPVHLIDTPGFSDSKISEIEIMEMVKMWLKENDFQYVQRILFVMPITGTRLPGSRRRTLIMLKQLLAPEGNQHSALTFVTTMWDTLHNEQTRKRAESNFEQLRDDMCKDFFGKFPVPITRFTNTKSSVLEALDTWGSPSNAFFWPHYSTWSHLYQDLHERIENALQAKQRIESELAQPEAQTNTELMDILKRNERENQETLTKFIQQFVKFGPLPAEFRPATQHLRKLIAANACPMNIKWEEPSQPLSFKDIRHFTHNAVKRRSAKLFKRGG